MTTRLGRASMQVERSMLDVDCSSYEVPGTRVLRGMAGMDSLSKGKKGAHNLGNGGVQEEGNLRSPSCCLRSRRRQPFKVSGFI